MGFSRPFFQDASVNGTQSCLLKQKPAKFGKRFFHETTDGTVSVVDVSAIVKVSQNGPQVLTILREKRVIPGL